MPLFFYRYGGVNRGFGCCRPGCAGGRGCTWFCGEHGGAAASGVVVGSVGFNTHTAFINTADPGPGSVTVNVNNSTFGGIRSTAMSRRCLR